MTFPLTLSRTVSTTASMLPFLRGSSPFPLRLFAAKRLRQFLAVSSNNLHCTSDGEKSMTTRALLWHIETQHCTLSLSTHRLNTALSPCQHIDSTLHSLPVNIERLNTALSPCQVSTHRDSTLHSLPVNT